jgi:hypothetical protein
MSTPDPVLVAVAQIKATVQAMQSAAASALAALDALVVTYKPPPPPPPPPPSGPVVTALSVADGATIADGTAIVATVTGNPARVDFVVDGGTAHQEGVAPYTINGDDGTTANPWHPGAGQHTVVVTPYDGAGKAGTGKTITVTVSGTPPPPPPPPSGGKKILALFSYWSLDMGKVDKLIASKPPAGTLMLGGWGITGDGPWYANDNPNGGAGSAQQQSRDANQASHLAAAHAAGIRCTCYIAVNGCVAGTGFDKHYSDLNAVLGKVDLAFKLYPELDGIFFDEAPYTGATDWLAAMRDRVKAHGAGKLVILNLAGYQQSADRNQYSDYQAVHEAGTLRPANGGSSNPDMNGPYLLDSIDGYAQPDFVKGWGTALVEGCGAPNDPALAGKLLQLCKDQNLAGGYITDRAAYYERWSDLASNPLWAAEVAAFKGQ